MTGGSDFRAPSPKRKKGAELVPVERSTDDVSEVGPPPSWERVKDEETGKYYWWCEETDEVTSLDAPRPPSWREVRTEDGEIYYWNEETDETTALGEPRPRFGDESRHQTEQESLTSSSIGGGLSSMVVQGAAIGLGFGIVGLIFSDARLKRDVQKIGTSKSGLSIYTFRYKHDASRTLYKGVIAQEVTDRDAVFRVPSKEGYLAVDYTKIDVDFKDIPPSSA